jgi:chromosome segregation ATPase
MKQTQLQVETLKKDNDRLKRDLEVETRQARLTTTTSSATQIMRMQVQSESFTKRIEQERQRIDDLLRQISNTHEQIMALKVKMKGGEAQNAHNQKLEKEIMQLENKLDKALVKLNEANTNNKLLRETIENLRRERQIFDSIYKKLEQELRDKKKEMAGIIDIYNEAMARRADAQADMVDMKLRADEEQKRFENEWKRLSYLVQQDRRSKLSTPGGPPNAGESALLSTTQIMSSASQETQEMELSLRQRIHTKNFDIESDRAAIALATTKVAKFEDTFTKIQTETKITSIDELVTKFVTSEDQNFSLFNYVNDLNTEIEKLEEATADLRKEAEKYRPVTLSTQNLSAQAVGTGTGVAPLSVPEQRKKMLDDLDAKLVKAEADANAVETKYSAVR